MQRLSEKIENEKRAQAEREQQLRAQELALRERELAAREKALRQKELEQKNAAAIPSSPPKAAPFPANKAIASPTAPAKSDAPSADVKKPVDGF